MLVHPERSPLRETLQVSHIIVPFVMIIYRSIVKTKGDVDDLAGQDRVASSGQWRAVLSAVTAFRILAPHFCSYIYSKSFVPAYRVSAKLANL